MARLHHRTFKCSRSCKSDHYRCQACGKGVCVDSVDVPSLRGLNSDQLIKKLAALHAELHGTEHEYHFVYRHWWR